jgi:hypothetical protein
LRIQPGLDPGSPFRLRDPGSLGGRRVLDHRAEGRRSGKTLAEHPGAFILAFSLAIAFLLFVRSRPGWPVVLSALYPRELAGFVAQSGRTFWSGPAISVWLEPVHLNRNGGDKRHLISSDLAAFPG